MTGACVKPPPGGQVLADVGGVDVTRRDLGGELQAGGNPDTALSVALNRLVDRRLLVQAAQAQALDRTPEYLAAVRRARDEVLADMYVRRLAVVLPPVAEADVEHYLADHPFTFARRALVSVIHIETSPQNASALAGETSIDAAVKKLEAHDLAFTRTVQTLDTAAISPDLAARLTDGGGGMMLDRSPGGCAAYEVTDIHAVPDVGEAARQRAQKAVTLARLTEAVARHIERERSRTTIRYQAGLGPSRS